ncbi:hypothetical protein A9513_020740 [Pseudomonas sp. AU12215]|nr:hypothetical protein A9513_020740 [Pseudomonas sp. AU12215]
MEQFADVTAGDCLYLQLVYRRRRDGLQWLGERECSGVVQQVGESRHYRVAWRVAGRSIYELCQRGGGVRFNRLRLGNLAQSQRDPTDIGPVHGRALVEHLARGFECHGRCLRVIGEDGRPKVLQQVDGVCWLFEQRQRIERRIAKRIRHDGRWLARKDRRLGAEQRVVVLWHLTEERRRGPRPLQARSTWIP